MSRSAAATAALWLTLFASAPASAQLPHGAVELFGTFGGVAGVTTVQRDGAAHGVLHGGLRFDGGIQGERVGLGVGLRVWEMAPTRSFGGHGLDAFFQGELRSARDARTTVRLTAGAGFDELDPGRGPYRDNTGSQGLLLSAGVAREVIAPSGARLLLSADLLLPHIDSGVDGRRLPILEVGFGYRGRTFRAVELPTPRRARISEARLLAPTLLPSLRAASFLGSEGFA